MKARGPDGAAIQFFISALAWAGVAARLRSARSISLTSHPLGFIAPPSVGFGMSLNLVQVYQVGEPGGIAVVEEPGETVDAGDGVL